MLSDRTFFYSFKLFFKSINLVFTLSFSLISFSTANSINIIPTPNMYIHHGRLNQNILVNKNILIRINTIDTRKAGPYFLKYENIVTINNSITYNIPSASLTYVVMAIALITISIIYSNTLLSSA